jgi:hypothetical protein
VSAGPGGVIHRFTKPDAGAFGSINPDKQGPAIWVRYTLANGTPIYVLYGHTAASWVDNTAITNKKFIFDCKYTTGWKTGNTVDADTVIGLTAPFYLNQEATPHLHVGIFKPNNTCKGNYCEPPLKGWGYGDIVVPEGEFIDPEVFFTDPHYWLAP